MGLLKLFLLYFLITVLIGCRKPIPEPHLGDYIYLELKQELSKSETKLTEVKKEHDDFISKSKNPSLTYSDLKVARAKANFTLNQITKLEQKVKYWKFKLLSREELVRKHYLSSFNKGEEWNNEEEVLRYKKAKNWGKRLPANKSQKTDKSEPIQTEANEKVVTPEESKSDAAEPSNKEDQKSN